MENVPESLQLFGMCQSMRWNHLPVHGGIYDQHPQLLAEWRIIFNIQNQHEKNEYEKQKRESKSSGRR